MIQIILIRHGRTAWNAAQGQDRRFRGIIDLPLADEGISQAQTTTQHLANLDLTAIYSSPLERAACTAQMIADPHGLEAQILPGLASMNYGNWAGQLEADVARRWPDLYRQWRHDPFSTDIPGGESSADLRDRAVAALRAVLTRHADGDTIALVSHQAVTKSVICTLLGMPSTTYWLVRQDLCNLSSFDYDPTTDEFSLVALNDTCHLNPALPRTSGRGARIILVRHGQTAWNAGAGEERFRGRTDLPLDETGQAQSRAVASRLQDEPIAALYTSSLIRTRQTIEPLAEHLDLPVQVHRGLIDIHYGLFQGLTYSQAATIYSDQYTWWRTQPSQVRFPDGESLANIQTRLSMLVDEMATRHRGQTIVLVGHQIVNKVLACMLLGLDLDQIWHIQQDTCGLDIFQQVGDDWHTLRLNDTCHLREDGRRQEARDST